MHIRYWFALLIPVFLTVSCQQNETDSTPEPESYIPPENALFTKKDPEKSKVNFENILKEDEHLNYLNYTYLYNGSGLAVIDYNNDGLKDIFFVGTVSSNRLFKNKGNWEFEDVSEQAGIGGGDRLKTGVAIHDLNGDGWEDIYVCHSGLDSPESLTNALYINNGDGTFSEEAVARGLDDRSNTNHALFFDYDNDGDLDLYLLNHPTSFKKINTMQLQRDPDGNITRAGVPTNPQEGDMLFKNKGDGTFTDVSKEAGVWGRAYGLSITPMDINEDGWMDLYIANDFVEPDFLYINQKNGTFKNELDSYFPHISSNSMGADAADVNNDGKLDFVCLDMLPEDNYRQQTLITSMRYDRYKSLEQHDYGRQIMHNMLFIKGEDGKMREVGNLAGIDATDWSWSPLITDYDLDGMNDIFITNGYRRDLTDLDYLTYYEDLIKKGEDPKDFRKELLEIVPTTPIPNYMFHNQGQLKFVNKANEWGLGEKTFSNGAVHADLDNDGDEDLVVNNFDMIASLYENHTDERDQNWVQVELNGPKGNSDAIGANITVRSDSGEQSKNVRRIKGFMSYSTDIVTFGLGTDSIIHSIEVVWPDGKRQSLAKPSINGRITIDYDPSGEHQNDQNTAVSNNYFGPARDLIDFMHVENEFIDVKREPLIPRCFSREGPITEVLDFNKDGKDDILIGGAQGQPTQLWLQNAAGGFDKLSLALFEQEKGYEDVAFAIGDFNNDSYPDIYIGSGGNAEPNGSPLYEDRLYYNSDGRTLTKAKLPKLLSSTGTVSCADFDMDGDLDIFVGGYVTPNAYPLPQRSYLLINEGGTFKNATSAWSEELSDVGMCSSSKIHDFNGDGLPDLLIAGEWMPIMWFPNMGDKFGDPVVVDNTSGWWMNLHLTDWDGDGDQDIIAGNLGLNTKWSASPEEPMEIYAKDFDRNGKFDALITHYVMGEKSVAARRKVLMEQMPALRPDFVKFSEYAKAKIDEIVDIDQPDVYHRSVSQLASIWLENKGDGQFITHSLPIETQIAPIYAINTIDLDGDGMEELLAGGNDFHLEIETARADGNTLFLIDRMNHKLVWKPLDGRLNVFNKALRDIDFIRVKDETHLVLSFNDDKIHFFPIRRGGQIQ